MYLDMADFNPQVLRAAVFDGYVGRAAQGGYAARDVYDYVLEYYTRSDGGIEIDGVYTPMAEGDVNIRKPGQVVRGVPPYRCYIICFDARGREARRDYMFGTREEAQPRYQNPILDALPDRISCSPGSGIDKLFERAYRLEGAAGPEARLYMRTVLMEILSALCELVSPSARRISPEVRRAAAEISERFAGELSVDELMELSGLSRATFHRRFLREMGRTPLEMITELRMSRARELLVLTDYSIADVADMCGYSDNSYFARAFRRACGVTPGEFRIGRRRVAEPR